LDVSGTNRDMNITFEILERGTRKNYEGTDTYEYDGTKSGLEYRLYTQLCGSEVDNCSKVIQSRGLNRYRVNRYVLLFWGNFPKWLTKNTRNVKSQR